jgi:hypothetical protein
MCTIFFSISGLFCIEDEKIQSLHHFGTSVYGLCLQLWGLGCIYNAMIMSNGSGVIESIANS